MAKYRANSTDPWKTLKIKALDSMVIGSVIDYAGKEEKIPAGWLICDGSAISRTEYSELFDTIGTKWGTGDGSTTFNVPPAGIVRVGYDANDNDFNAVGKTGGSKYIQQHTHSVNERATTFSGTGSYAPQQTSGDRSWNNLGVGNVQGVQTGNSGNLQPYGTFYTIIKAKNTTPTMASIVDAYSTSTQDGYSCDYVNGKTGVVLYENSSGTYTDVTLNDNLSNYNYLEIYATTNSNSYINCNKVALNVISNKKITISNFENVYYRYADYELGTNKLTLQNTYGYYELLTGNHSTSQNFIKIVKVVGYK